LSKSFKAVRNSFYCIPQGAGADMKYGIELWRGLFISARVIDGFRPAINIDGVMEIGFHFCEKLLIIEMDFSITQLLLQASVTDKFDLRHIEWWMNVK
ncbi:putative protein tag-76, partial [Trichinella spiralis]|uniref:putative protein tag-76 n=1 Tax=Trichinella spiralis TaxID=6334 RepID=UPI0001EFDD11